MLDLDHPQAQHIFRASGLLGALLMAEQKMCVVCDEERGEVLARCRPILVELQQLNEAHFESSPFIKGALDELEAALG